MNAFQRPRLFRGCLPALAAAMLAASAARGDEPYWTPLFNGRDLTGWVNVNCAPDTFTVHDEMIVSGRETVSGTNNLK